ncbi:MAG: hypothetical protein WDA06_01405 [Phenylobacterium sp.]
MFKKEFQSDNSNPVNPDNMHFLKGTKFVRDGKLWVVLEEAIGDSAPMRRVRADDGTEEVVMLNTLVKDSQAKDFAFVRGSNVV